MIVKLHMYVRIFENLVSHHGCEVMSPNNSLNEVSRSERLVVESGSIHPQALGLSDWLSAAHFCSLIGRYYSFRFGPCLG